MNTLKYTSLPNKPMSLKSHLNTTHRLLFANSNNYTPIRANIRSLPRLNEWMVARINIFVSVCVYVCMYNVHCTYVYANGQAMVGVVVYSEHTAPSVRRAVVGFRTCHVIGVLRNC